MLEPQVEESILTGNKHYGIKSERKTVLITGASSGIGLACAQELFSQGYIVYGTVRRGQAGSFPFSTINMDVTNTDSIKRGVGKILEKEKKIDILINNAGVGVAGPIEDTSIEEAKYQFDTNFFGLVDVCKNVIPIMRAEGGGKILNISSIGGLIGLPFQGFYSASKFAVEGFSEALRLEVKKYNIDVAIIEPGDVKTKFTANRKVTQKSLDAGLYLEQLQKSLKTIEADENNGIEPQIVAKKIAKILSKKSLKTRYLVGLPLQILTAKLKTYLPSGVFESIIASHYKC